MKQKATFYHAGCPVCVDAESVLINAIDSDRFDLEIVHLGEDNSRLDEARAAGVKSVPALVLESNVYHINFGASMDDLA
ncbi:MAG: hypothetical protein ACK5NT_08570 [Pyrinomonadaceae bacterium]